MPVGNARKAQTQTAKFRTASRATRRLALATIFTLLGSNGLHTAIANGDTRTITLHHTHRGDDITVTFKRNGRYDEEGLKKLNHFLRDWRTDDATTMDPHLFDAVWEVVREFGADKQVHIISSYRSPKTNAMLRSRSNGVARHSLHMQGKAIDFFVPGVSLEKVREAGLRLQRGGVGFYPTSGSPFVHMDVGNVRHWPRMTREQLVKVFPNQQTVHLPTDGKPLAGFALAQAQIEKRGSSSAYETVRVATADTKKPNALARMFGFGKPKPAVDDDESDSETAAPAQVASAAAPTKRDNVFSGMNLASAQSTPAPAPAAAPAPALAAVPVPKSRPAPAAPQQVAAAQPAAPAPRVAGTYALAAITPNDVILSRGYWQGLPEPHSETSASRRVGHDLGPDTTTASTGSIGPFAAPPGYGEGKPRETTLSFASQAEPEPHVERVRPVVPAIPRTAAIAANTTIASKARPNAASDVQSAPPVADANEIELRRWDGPWMRALIMTPSVERFMSTTLYGTPDFRALRPMLQKPQSMVVMAFAPEPNSGLSHQRFEGRAISFIATATFLPRSASLR